MTSHPLTSNNRGVAIIAVTMLMVVATLLGGVMLSQVVNDAQLSNRTYADKQALYLAESAKERGYREILDDNTFMPANVGDPPTILDGAIGVDDGNVQAGTTNTYNLVVTRLSDSPAVVQMVATGTGANLNNRTVTVAAEVIRENVFVWNNAIFGGSGQTGGVLSGQAAIHGSVHLLGDGVGEGNNAITAIDLIGSTLIHNNYVGMPAELAALVPDLPTQDFGGETDIATLNAKLRVKNGAVGVSGSAEIGEVNIIGNGIKETMNGIYIETDSAATRWTGNKVVDGVPDPGSVQSDNGTNALYDLGDAVSLPLLDEPYTDDDTGITYATYETYFNEYSLALPALTFDGTCSTATDLQAYFTANPDPNVTFTTDGCSFTITQTDVINGVPTTNTLTYTPPGTSKGTGTAYIEADGMFTIDGDMVVGKKDLDFKYTGEATFYATDSIDFHSNILPNDNDFTSEGYVFGFMAKNDINLATGPGDSQLSMAGAFYAQDTIKSMKQNEILGTFVCNYYDMGTNVPKIYQVPNLANNLPPGLIGSDPVWVTTGFAERYWRVD